MHVENAIPGKSLEALRACFDPLGELLGTQGLFERSCIGPGDECNLAFDSLQRTFCIVTNRDIPEACPAECLVIDVEPFEMKREAVGIHGIDPAFVETKRLSVFVPER